MKFKNLLGVYAAKYLDKLLAEETKGGRCACVLFFEPIGDVLTVTSKVIGETNMNVLISSMMVAAHSYWIEAGGSESDFVGYINAILNKQVNKEKVVYH